MIRTRTDDLPCTGHFDMRVERQAFQTRQEARLTIFEYIACFYNRERRHSTLQYLSPVAYEQQRS